MYLLKCFYLQLFAIAVQSEWEKQNKNIKTLIKINLKNMIMKNVKVIGN